MYRLNAAETPETQTRMNKFQPTLGNMNRNPWQLAAIQLYGQHSKLPRNCFFRKCACFYKSLKLQWLAKESFAKLTLLSSLSQVISQGSYQTISFFITKCFKLNTEFVLAGQLCVLFFFFCRDSTLNIVSLTNRGRYHYWQRLAALSAFPSCYCQFYYFKVILFFNWSMHIHKI